MNDQSAKWVRFLDDWRAAMLSVWHMHKERWDVLGLPNVAELERSPVDLSAVRQLQDDWHEIDREVVGFYSATNGWPLWMGSFWISIAPAAEVGLLSEIYPEAFAIALESAPDSRAIDDALQISKKDIRDAIVASRPDARELVLWLRSGQTCVYRFDGMELFPNFYEFMRARRSEVLRWASEMLAS